MRRHVLALGLLSLGTLFLAACSNTAAPSNPETPSAASSSEQNSIVPPSEPVSSSESAALSSASSREAASVPPKTMPRNTTVQIVNFAFTPANITVPVGTTVVWDNQDSAPHTVTGDNGGPASATLSTGQKYSYTFTAAGTFPYHCSIHTMMKATVTVTP